MRKVGVIFIFLVLMSYGDAASISGRVFEDFNSNYNVEWWENLTNSEIILFNLDNFNEISSLTINGNYNFNVIPGRYIITQRLSIGEVFTFPKFGFYYIIIKDENEIVNNKDFYNFKLGKIYGYIKNKNNEPLQNIQVNLSNNFTLFTNKDGYYEFKDLGIGIYEITAGGKSINNIIINSGSVSENNFVLDKENIVVERKKTFLDKFYEDAWRY